MTTSSTKENKNIDEIINIISNMTEDEMFLLRTKMAKKFEIDLNSIGTSVSASVEENEDDDEQKQLKSLFIKDVSEVKEDKLAAARVLKNVIDMNFTQCIRALGKANLPLLIKEDLKTEEIAEIKKLFENVSGILFEEK